MRRTLTWLGIYLPWIVGAGLLFTFCVQAYVDGRTFTPGLHAFGFLLKMAVGAIFFALAVAIALLVIVFAAKQRATRKGPRSPMLAVATSLVLPLLALPAMSGSLSAGRNAAYRSVDCQAIYEACMELRGRVIQSGIDFNWMHTQGNKDDLPPAIRRLSPLDVYCTPNAAIVQMDGGGVASHEGIGVVFGPKESGRFSLRGTRPLHDSLPVYVYRLYDSRILLDSARQGE